VVHRVEENEHVKMGAFHMLESARLGGESRCPERAARMRQKYDDVNKGGGEAEAIGRACSKKRQRTFIQCNSVSSSGFARLANMK
jgi:hypothetical protein